MPTTEFDLIHRHFSHYGAGPDVALSVGDDCAILTLAPDERLATSVDTLVEGVHFLADTFPEDLGIRAVSVAASDLAAMGARPLGMTLALTLPEADDFWLHAFSQGVGQAVSAYRLPLVGGDTTRGPLTITVQVMGALPGAQALRRSGARAGDAVYVSGSLGDAAAGLALLRGERQAQAEATEYLVERYNRPLARLALGRELLGRASAVIDISDGLLQDAGHIAAASGLCLQLESAAIPMSDALLSLGDSQKALHWALSGGDDYELCFTLPTGQAPPADCTRIGTAVEGEGVKIDVPVDFPAGYQHF